MERQLMEALQNLVNAIKNNQEFLSLPIPEIMKAYTEAEDLLSSESYALRA